ncbi:uncharacterized protein BO72DRAFT_90273 [Aspergillus fijiensis CBS 313.89]|uniref:Uncharacterized protein n=1 Tax=Aspergillus fijiensis CBS 313.89 TaxID=1448319 RepID=A0A8G1W497_9EURO|nr:uncharacterized protein BO72DRAFT_90273 [Aspergillus fijiensis CBS 313.89]RAK82411.1 hypothetical protein BO72DRAFT_90273 [Aspergillus fijiensis CBS 313.89]
MYMMMLMTRWELIYLIYHIARESSFFFLLSPQTLSLALLLSLSLSLSRTHTHTHTHIHTHRLKSNPIYRHSLPLACRVASETDAETSQER